MHTVLIGRPCKMPHYFVSAMMRKHSCSICCIWARTDWWDADTLGVALSLRSEDDCKTFTAKTPLCKQDKVLQAALPRTERQKKVLLGCIEREEHSQHILLCEKGCQLGWAACRDSYFKCFVTARAVGELEHAYTGMKNILYTPPKFLNKYFFTILSCPHCWQKGIWGNSAGNPGPARWQLLGSSHE